MALSRWPTTPHPKLLPWAIWRFRNKPGQNPWPVTIPKYAWEFLKWAEWRRNLARGIIKPRPDVTPKIPAWGWTLLKQLNIAVPIAPPPPPPPPANPIPPNSWKLPNPLVFMSWGPILEWNNNIDGIAATMADANVGTVALQGGLFRSEQASRLRGFGFKIAVWGEPSGNDAAYLAEANADGYIPQIEGDSQYEAALNNLRAGVGQGLSLSSVTTLTGLDTFTTRPDGTEDGQVTTVEVEELAEEGLTHMFIECYTGDMRPMDVSNMMFTGEEWRGIYHSNPTIGLAREDVFVSTYQPDIDRYGRQLGIYLAEPMRSIDWAAVKNL